MSDEIQTHWTPEEYGMRAAQATAHMMHEAQERGEDVHASILVAVTAPRGGGRTEIRTMYMGAAGLVYEAISRMLTDPVALRQFADVLPRGVVYGGLGPGTMPEYDAFRMPAEEGRALAAALLDVAGRYERESETDSPRVLVCDCGRTALDGEPGWTHTVDPVDGERDRCPGCGGGDE